ncbi:hypothetical protein EH221_05730 [bacterium]|nr:MAG: hypothetical protein EH221_05730 [bacterium]
MRILANFTKKVSTGNYENETFAVSVECETEFNNVPEVTDYLFREAREAVLRQLNGENASNGKPAISLPGSKNGSMRTVPDCLKDSSDTPKSDQKMTTSQRRYLFRLLAERGIKEDQVQNVLTEHFQTKNLNEVTKSQASTLIEELVNTKG